MKLFIVLLLSIQLSVNCKRSGGRRGQDQANGSSSDDRNTSEDTFEPQSREEELYGNPNTKLILEGLSMYGSAAKITQDRYTTEYNNYIYYHGSRFYNKTVYRQTSLLIESLLELCNFLVLLQSDDKLTCFYEPLYLYYAQYEDYQKVTEIIFECDFKSQYCSELECSSRTAWWIVV